MWVLAMFDLPVTTKRARREAAQFRRALQDDGFTMIQYSVYTRPCPSDENARLHEKRIAAALPQEGEVRTLVLTDLQFTRMRIYFQKRRENPESPPQQLTLF